MTRLLLAGAGHAHALVLLDFVRSPPPGVEAVVVSPQPLAPYSGMVPGWLAGRYAFDEIVVDFPRLCAAAGARWVEGEVEALDAACRRARLSDGSAIDFDLLSLDVGSTLRPPPTVHAVVLALRPLAALRAGYDAVLERWAGDARGGPFVVTAVGGGAAGFESLLAVLARLRRMRPDRRVEGRLVSRGEALLADLSAPARKAAQRALRAAGVEIRLGAGWNEADDRRSDLVLWATGAEAHDWLRDPVRRGPVAVDEAGFVRVDRYLRSVSDPRVFAAGDCARWDVGAALPKAGVYAVRMGPVLANNLRIALGGRGAMRTYRPQRRFLALLATGDGRAIASRGAFGAAGAWAWRWKDHIDRRFMAGFGVGGAGATP